MPPKSCPLQKTVDMGVICFLAKTYMIFFVVLDVKTSTTPKLLIHIRSWKRQSLIHTEKKSSSLLPILDALQKYQLAVGLRFSLPFTGWFVIVLFVFITINVYGL
jgi:hypothetical protein